MSIILPKRITRRLDPSPALPSEVGQIKISVIVPVRNEAEHIEDTLHQLLGQEYEGDEFEVLVVDGQSTDRTRDVVRKIASKHGNIRLLDNPQRLSSAARNKAIQNSRGEYVVLIDGHCEIPSRTYFTDLVDVFQRTGVDCLGRPQPLDVTDAIPIQQAITLARGSRLGHHAHSYIYTNKDTECPALSVAIAYRRSVFERVGLFDEHFDACEDCELNHRIDQAGLTCRLVPKLAVKYKPRKSISGLFRQLFRYGRGRVRLFRKHPDSFSVRAFVPAVFVAGVVCGPLACWVLPSLWPVYGSVMGLYLLAILARSVLFVLVNKNIRVLPWLPCVFAAIHFGSGAGVLWETIHPKKPHEREPPAELKSRRDISD